MSKEKRMHIHVTCAIIRGTDIPDDFESLPVSFAEACRGEVYFRSEPAFSERGKAP